MNDEEIVQTGNVDVDFSNNTEIQITTESVNPDLDRKDKSVTIKDKNGLEQRSSSIMMGYNKQSIVLADGSFISEEDIEKAIQEELKRQEPGTLIVHQKTLAQINLDELFEMIKEISGAIIIEGKNPNVKNQDSRNWGVQGKNGEIIDKGVAFLGNKGIELSPGTYVSVEEIRKALEDYVYAKKIQRKPPEPPKPPRPPEGPEPPKPPRPPEGPEPPKPPRPPEGPEPPKPPQEPEPPKPPQEPEEEEEIIIARVVRKYKSGVAAFLIPIMMFIGGIDIDQRYRDIVYQRMVNTEAVTQTIDYDMHTERYRPETKKEAADRVIDEMEMGDKVPVKDGEEFYVNSNETGPSKTMGEEFKKEGKEAGDYQITGFAIVVNGEPIEYIEDFNGIDDQSKLKEFVEEALKKHNLTIDDIEIKVHLGSNKDGSRLGWIDITDLITTDTITPELIKEIVEDYSAGSGTITDFTGDTITLPDGTTIKIVDENGNYLKPGTEVTGSDNQKYRIEKLDVTTETKTISTPEEITESVPDGIKVEWKLNNLALAASLVTALYAIANALSTYKKNKESEENPSLFEFENEKQYIEFKIEFRKAKKKYEEESKFGKLMRRVFIGKNTDIMQRLTPEQAKEVYAIIKRHSGIDYIIGPNDKIEIKGGQIYLHYADKHIQNITDIVIEEISAIGKENPIDAEGRLVEKDNENGNNRK